MFTLNQAIKRLRDITESNLQVNPKNEQNHFGFGDLWEVGNVLTDDGALVSEKFPLVWANVGNSRVEAAEGNTQALLNIDFQILFMDLVRKGEQNEIDVLSDQLLIATDFITALQDQNEYYEHKYNVAINSDLTSFTERFDHELAGWAMNITFQISYSANECAIPTA